MATEKEVHKLLTSIAPLYANYKVPNEADAVILAKAWHKVVGHLERDILQAAMLDAVTHTEFFPTPMLVLDRVAVLKLPPSMSGEQAWGLVLAEVKRGMGYPYQHLETTITDANILGAVTDIGGWRMLALSTDEEDISHRMRFSKAYEARVKRGHNDMKELPAVAAVRLQIAGQRAAQMAQLTAAIGKEKAP